MDKFLTVTEVAEMLRVSRGTAIGWVRKGQIKAFKPGGGRSWRIRLRDLRKFINEWREQ